MRSGAVSPVTSPVGKSPAQQDVSTYNSCFDRVLARPHSFVVKHYAGDVEYGIRGFLAKNRDKLHDSLAQFLATSKCKLLRDLFTLEVFAAKTSHVGRTQQDESNNPVRVESPRAIFVMLLNVRFCCAFFFLSLSQSTTNYGATIGTMKLHSLIEVRVCSLPSTPTE